MDDISHRDIDGLSATFEVQAFSPMLWWEARQETYRQLILSKETWELMSDEIRDALVERVKRAMEVSYDTVEDWLPTALSLDDGSALNVNFVILMSSLQADADAALRTTSKTVERVRTGLKQMIDEMEQEDEAFDSKS